MTAGGLLELSFWWVIPAAVILDLLAGDPRSLPHPVRWMGRCIETGEFLARSLPLEERAQGAVLAAVLTIGWALAALALTGSADAFSPMLRAAVEGVALYYCISIRSLADAALEIHRLLASGRVDEARDCVAMIVGRDVEGYGAADIARATVETVAENFVDGVLTPLVVAAVGGVPLAVAFKTASTLDSMVGYTNDRYRRFGTASARLDDAFNFVPARLSVPIVSLSAWILWRGPAALRAFRTAVSQGSRHLSPNAGFPEAAWAGALGVRLGGPETYGGVRKEKAVFGEGNPPVAVSHILNSVSLLRLCSLLGAALACGIALAR